ncbi:hypothetical protein [Haloarchaeobius sp. DYHT-AS-18]|uniref:hypothetical protein n=1 Tax=Haloarchaeobius sp. DYHT-AS-18 TaxID=3446117 RepID=UPI003EBD9400
MSSWTTSTVSISKKDFADAVRSRLLWGLVAVLLVVSASQTLRLLSLSPMPSRANGRFECSRST